MWKNEGGVFALRLRFKRKMILFMLPYILQCRRTSRLSCDLRRRYRRVEQEPNISSPLNRVVDKIFILNPPTL